MVTSETLQAYDQSRASGTDRSVLCHAPFVSLNFDQSGHVTACCYNREYVLGTYPSQSVRDIWTGPPAVALREAFLRGSPVRGCEGCFDQLRLGNYAGALMRNFDGFSVGRPPRRNATVDLPIVLEFEISNTCSLECVMCAGHWSSAIRDRRERLPPLRNPYDRAFVEQLDEILPSVVVARFLGGEPFLIPRYHEIWNRMRQLSPGAELSITTSAAIVPERPRRILDDLRAHIVVSLDGITAATYESIRQHARFDQVLANVEDFRAYTRRQGTTLTVACCPMTHNWRELVRLVDFCEAKEMRLFFNTVTAPVESSLACLPAPDLDEVITVLDAESRTRVDGWTSQSQQQWRGLMNQLRGWFKDKQALSWIRDWTRPPARAATRDQPPAESRVPPSELRRTASDIRQVLDERVARAMTADRDDLQHRRLREYLECLLIEHISAQWQQTENGSSASYDAVGRIVGEADRRLAVEAVQLFVDVVRPQDLDRLRGRLSRFREALGEAADLALRDVYQVHWVMVRLSDQAFAEQLAEHLGVESAAT